MSNCFECDFEVGIIYCENCGHNLCAFCNARKHFVVKSQIRHFYLNNHKFGLLCEECECKPRTNYCQECDEKLCEDCFKYLHKKAKR